MKEKSPAASRHVLSVADRNRIVVRVSEALAADDTVLFAYLFGSFLEDRPFGDVDVAVFVDASRFKEMDTMTVQFNLAHRLERVAGLPVDIVLLNQAPLGLRMIALKGRLIHSRGESQRLAFVESTSLQAMDMAYLARESLRDLLIRSV